MANAQPVSTGFPSAPPASSQPLLNQPPAAVPAAAPALEAAPKPRRRRAVAVEVPPAAPAAPPAPTPVTPERVAAAFGGAIVPHVGAPLPATAPVARPHVPAAPVAVVEGLEEVTREDLIIPRFSVVQPTSKVGEHPGHFRDSISEVEVPELKNVSLLKVRKGRVWFKSAESKDADCASDDMIVPSTRIEHPVSAQCAGCPQAKWSENKDFKRCHETYTLLILHDGVPYFLTFKSAAIKQVKKLLTQLALRGAKEKRSAYAYKFDITLQMEEFDVGKAYMPRFERLMPITDTEELATAKALFAQFASARPTFDPPEERTAPAAGAEEEKDAPFKGQF